MNGRPLLQVNSLVTRLKNGARIVDDISFAIGRGETFALVGESGSGKSMTALSLMRLLPESIHVESGAVQLEDAELLALPERAMREVRGGKMAMIFQEPGLSLNPVMTVGAQIAEALELHQGLRGKAAEARSIALLEQVGIPDAPRRVREYPFQMSGGMKQRVMIAIALAGQPKLLVADEPTTALDVTIQAQVLQLLRETQKQNGMALLLITHDLGVVAQMAHQVGVMYAGHIVELATREQLFSHPAHPYTKKLFAALPEAQRRGQPLDAIPGSVPPLSAIPEGCRFAPRCEAAWELCHEKSPEWITLEGGQRVRCHLYRGGTEAGEEQENKSAGTTLEPSTERSSSAPTLLEVTDLKVHFPIRKGILQRTVGQVRAVDGVSLAVAAGRTVALVGESGCGKTTTGKALLRLIEPTSGSVRLGGAELVGLDTSSLRKRRAGMQMVFQDPFASLNPKLRVAEILQEGMDALGVAANNEARQQRIDELLDQVGLAQGSKWRYPHEFSGGQRQRIAIARALAVNPQLLICDEPTSALDVSVQAQILNLLKSLQQELNLSYLFISHNLGVVEYLAHEVCVMYLGRIVERGSAEEVLQRPQHPYTQALLAAVPRIDVQGMAVMRTAGDQPSPANPPQGCHYHPRCPQAMAVCKENYPEASAKSLTHFVHCYL